MMGSIRLSNTESDCNQGLGVSCRAWHHIRDCYSQSTHSTSGPLRGARSGLPWSCVACWSKCGPDNVAAWLTELGNQQICLCQARSHLFFNDNCKARRSTLRLLHNRTRTRRCGSCSTSCATGRPLCSTSCWICLTSQRTAAPWCVHQRISPFTGSN